MAETSALVAYLHGDNQLEMIAKDSLSRFGADRAKIIVNGVISTLMANPYLWGIAQTAEGRKSVLMAIRDAVRVGLVPGTPLAHAYLVPYKKQIKMMIGYKGWIALLMRTGLFDAIEAYPVHEKDFFEPNFGTSPNIIHKPHWKDDAGKLICVYSVITMKGGYKQSTLMTLQEILDIRGRSEAYKSGKGCPWTTDFEAMALKTVIKRAIKQVAIDPTQEMIEAEQSEANDYIDADWNVVEDEEDKTSGVEKAKAAMKKEAPKQKPGPEKIDTEPDEKPSTPAGDPEWIDAYDELCDFVRQVRTFNPDAELPDLEDARTWITEDLIAVYKRLKEKFKVN